jgi:hypothetical protein
MDAEKASASASETIKALEAGFPMLAPDEEYV